MTVYYRPEELTAIKEWLKEHYKNSVKTVSFLLHSEHGFRQAPYSPITKEEYDVLITKVKPLATLGIEGGTMLEMAECANGSCPVR